MRAITPNHLCPQKHKFRLAIIGIHGLMYIRSL